MDFRQEWPAFEHAAHWFNYGVRASGVGIGAGFFLGQWWGVCYAALWLVCDLLHDAAVDWHSRKRLYVTRSITAVQIGMYATLYFAAFYISWRKIGLLIAAFGMAIAAIIGLVLRHHSAGDEAARIETSQIDC